jgi:Holliday junction resolvasome RuvABC endonuclease subunit
VAVVTSYYLGIDPGASGAIALIGVDELPLVWELKGMTRSEIVDLLWDTRDGLWDARGSTAAIERVSSMPGQGVASTFKFGVNYGGLLMALDAAGIPFFNPTPTTWKKAVDPYLIAPKEAKTEKKRRAREIAKRLFPTAKVTNATADALLLARYAQLKSQA